ncbi:hypothetical protein S83_040150, partial [Arachis hypogaea]
EHILILLGLVNLLHLGAAPPIFNFKLEWTTLRVLLLHHPLTHPNLRPFITFLGVALACLLARCPRWF